MEYFLRFKKFKQKILENVLLNMFIKRQGELSSCLKRKLLNIIKKSVNIKNINVYL